MADLESIKSKIAKLMALANDEGAADNEAETALRQANKLMQKHGIELAEILARSGAGPTYKWIKDAVPVSWPKPVKGQPLWAGWIGSSIGIFTDTKVLWLQSYNLGACIQFAGDETDVEYALWLMAHIRDKIRTQAALYRAPGTTSDERWANREEFRHAMARRISHRLKALRAERQEAFRQAGTALMVIDQKLALRDAEFGKQTYGNNRSYIRGSLQAQLAGQAAGEAVQFGRPVQDNDTTRRLK